MAPSGVLQRSADLAYIAHQRSVHSRVPPRLSDRPASRTRPYRESQPKFPAGSLFYISSSAMRGPWRCCRAAPRARSATPTTDHLPILLTTKTVDDRAREPIFRTTGNGFSCKCREPSIGGEAESVQHRSISVCLCLFPSRPRQLGCAAAGVSEPSCSAFERSAPFAFRALSLHALRSEPQLSVLRVLSSCSAL